LHFYSQYIVCTCRVIEPAILGKDDQIAFVDWLVAFLQSLATFIVVCFTALNRYIPGVLVKAVYGDTELFGHLSINFSMSAVSGVKKVLCLSLGPLPYILFA